MASVSMNPAEISSLGQKIYDEKFRVDYERQYANRFVAIEVASGTAYIGMTADEALSKAKNAFPNGNLYLVRIGSPGAFRISRTSHASNNRYI